MTTIVHTHTATDHQVATLIAGLDREFGAGAGESLAPYFLTAEECDFLWEARQHERWIGAWASDSDEACDLDRVVIMGLIAGWWFVAELAVDGNGEVCCLLGRRDFESQQAARDAFERPG